MLNALPARCRKGADCRDHLADARMPKLEGWELNYLLVAPPPTRHLPAGAHGGRMDAAGAWPAGSLWELGLGRGRVETARLSLLLFVNAVPRTLRALQRAFRTESELALLRCDALEPGRARLSLGKAAAPVDVDAEIAAERTRLRARVPDRVVARLPSAGRAGALELVLDPSIEIDKDAVVIGRVVGGSAQLAELTTEISDAGPAALGEVRVLSWSSVADDDAQHANA